MFADRVRGSSIHRLGDCDDLWYRSDETGPSFRVIAAHKKSYSKD